MPEPQRLSGRPDHRHAHFKNKNRVDNRSIDWLLWNASRNLCALSLAIISPQYSFCTMAENKVHERRKTAKKDIIRLADQGIGIGIGIELWSPTTTEQQNLTCLIKKHTSVAPKE